MKFRNINKVLKSTWKKNPEYIVTGVGAAFVVPSAYSGYKKYKKMNKLAKKHGLELGKKPTTKAEFKAFVNIHKELYGIK